MENITKYGDIIYLQTDKPPIIGGDPMTSDQHQFGLLGSNSFVCPRLWVRFLKGANPKDFDVATLFKNNRSFDSKECMFIIMPKLKYHYFKQKLKLEQNIQALIKKIELLIQTSNTRKIAIDSQFANNDYSINMGHQIFAHNEHDGNNNLSKETTDKDKRKRLEEILAIEKERLLQIEKNCIEEEKSNEEFIASMIGQAVSYSQTICLKHYISNYYVSISTNANVSNEELKAILIPTLSKKCYLEFFPKFSYRNPKSYIYYNDEIILKSKKKDFSLKFSQESVPVIDIDYFKFFMRKRIAYDTNIFSTYKCSFSDENQNQSDSFKILFCQKNEANNSQILCGDLVRIKNLDLNAYLEADLCYNTFEIGAEDVFLKQREKNKSCSKDCVWEINQISDRKQIVSHLVRNKGKEFSINQNFNPEVYFKHFMLGRIISNIDDLLVLHNKPSKYVSGEAKYSHQPFPKHRTTEKNLRWVSSKHKSDSADEEKSRILDSISNKSKDSDRSNQSKQDKKSNISLSDKRLKASQRKKSRVYDHKSIDGKSAKEILKEYKFEKLQEVPLMPNLLKSKNPNLQKLLQNNKEEHSGPKTKRSSKSHESNNSSDSSSFEEAYINVINKNSRFARKSSYMTKREKLHNLEIKMSQFKNGTNQITDEKDLNLQECFFEFHTYLDSMNVVNQGITYNILYENQFLCFRDKNTLKNYYKSEEERKLTLNSHKYRGGLPKNEFSCIEAKKNFVIPNLIEEKYKHKTILELSAEENTQCNFQIEKLLKNEIEDIYFVKSFIYCLMKIRHKLLQESLKGKKLKYRLEKILLLLSRFLTLQSSEKAPEFNYDFNSDETMNFDNQMLLNNFTCIEVLTDILYIANFEVGFMNQTQKISCNTTHEISKVSIKLLKLIIKNNNYNVVYCSRWYDMLVKLVVKNAKFNSSFEVESLILDMLKQNGNIIRTKVNNNSIEKFVLLTLGYKNFRYIKILRKLVSHNSKLNTRNQREVTMLLLNDQSKVSKFLLDINERHGRFSFKVPILNWDDMEPNDLISDEDLFSLRTQELEFFVQSIKLLCDLCKQRNYMAIQLFRKRFSYDKLTGLINYFDSSHYYLKSLFINFMRLIYVDVYSFDQQEYKCSIYFMVNENLIMNDMKKNIWNTQLSMKMNNFYDDAKTLRSKNTFKTQDRDKFTNRKNLEDKENQLSVFYNDMDTDFVQFQAIYDENFNVNPTNRMTTIERLIEFLNENLSILSNYDISKGMNLNFLDLFSSVLKFKLVMLKTEILNASSWVTYYEEIVILWNIFENAKKHDNSFQMNSNQINKKRASKTVYQIINRFLKIFKVFLHLDFRRYFSDLYLTNKSFSNKKALLDVYANNSDQLKRLEFVNPEQITSFLIKIMSYDQFKNSKKLGSIMQILYRMLSPFSSFNYFYDNSTLITDNYVIIYRNMLEISYHLERLAENCSAWMLEDDESKIDELKQILLRISLTLIKARIVQKNSMITNFLFDFDSNDMKHLKNLSEIITNNLLVYYINLFKNFNSEPVFKFIQELSCSLPIFRCLTKILREYITHIQYVSSSVKELLKYILFCIAGIILENEKCCNKFKNLSQSYVVQLLEADKDFCIVLFSYICWNKNFVNSIFRNNSQKFKMLSILIKYIAKEKDLSVKSFCLNILLRFYSINTIQKYQKIQRQMYFYTYVKLKDMLIDNLILMNEENYRYYLGFEADARILHNVNVKLITDKICLNLSIISLLIKISKGKNSLSKMIVQQFFSLKYIAKILFSNSVWFYVKHKHMQIILKVYSFKDNKNSVYFHEILEEIWISLIGLLIEEIASIQENRITYIAFDYLLTFTTANCMEMRKKYIGKIIQLIFEIIKSYYKFKIKEIESITFFQGLKKLLDYFSEYSEFNIFKSEFDDITRFVIENWKFGYLQHQKEIEDLLSSKFNSHLKGSMVNQRIYFNNQSDNLSVTSDIPSILQTNPLSHHHQMNRGKNSNAYLQSPNSMHPIQKSLTRGNKADQFENHRASRISLSVDRDTKEYIELDYKQIYTFIHNFRNRKVSDNPKLDLLKNVIQCLKIDFFKKNTNLDKIKSLKLLRFHIEFEVNNSSPSYQWNEDIFRKYQNTIVAKQKDLVDLNIAELILNIVENESIKFKVFNETMKLGIAVLFGGNKQAQDSFLQTLCSHPHSKFLQIIHGTIQDLVENLKPRFEQCYFYYIKKYIDNEEKSFKDLKSTKVSKKIEALNLIFRFLQLLCEGHNSSFQVFLQDQTPFYTELNIQNFNFIESSLNVLSIMVKFLNPFIITNCEKILDFLIETVQGPCSKNQEFLLKSRLIDYANDAFLELFNETQSDIKGFYNSQNIRKVDMLVMKFVRLFMSLLEADNTKTAKNIIKKELELNYLANHIQKGLREWLIKRFAKRHPEIKDIIERMETNKPEKDSPIQQTNVSQKIFGSRSRDRQIVARKQRDEMNTKESFNISMLFKMFDFMTFDEEICSLFEVYILLKTLLKEKEIKALNTDYKFLTSFFNHFTGKIEVCFKNNIYKIFFIIHPCCFYIEKFLLDRMLNDINRSTPIHKVNDLVDLSFRFFFQIEQQFYLNSKLKRFGINSNIYVVSQILVTVLGVCINFLILLLFEKKVENSYIVGDIENDNELIIITVLGYIVMIVLILKIILYIAFRGQTKFLLQMTSYENRLLKKIVNPENFERIVNLRFMHHEEPKVKLLKILSQYLENQNLKISPNFFYRYKQLKFFLKDSTINNSLLLLIFVVMAVFMKYTFLYSFLLLDLVQYFAIIRNIFKAISKNRKLLFLTIFLMLLIVYLYSVFAFIYLNSDFFMNDPGENSCQTIIHCFLTIINFGPRSTGSIGDVIQWPSFANMSHYFVRWYYDFSIWALINLICQNILLGIIIDTFAELDEQKKMITDDKENTCSICSLERHIFDKFTKGFKHHINVEHKVEHFMFFIYYLKYKEDTDLTGVESYIKNCIKYKDVSWVPILKAKSVKNALPEQPVSPS